jgi:hypothetical protein
MTAGCTRTIHHAAVPEKDVTFSALSDLFNGPWAQGVAQQSTDPDPQTAITPDDPADPNGTGADGQPADQAQSADQAQNAAQGSAGPGVGVAATQNQNLPTATPPPKAGTGSAPDPNNPILATIRQNESNNNYTIRAAGSSASGAYQILDEVWAGFGGYGSAAEAPPPVQDTKAAQLIISALSPSEDVIRIPVIWYIGHVPAPSSGEWDRVPAPYAGNVLTPRQYQAKWLGVYQQKYQAYQSQNGGG